MRVNYILRFSESHRFRSFFAQFRTNNIISNADRILELFHKPIIIYMLSYRTVFFILIRGR